MSERTLESVMFIIFKAQIELEKKMPILHRRPFLNILSFKSCSKKFCKRLKTFWHKMQQLPNILEKRRIF